MPEGSTGTEQSVAGNAAAVSDAASQERPRLSYPAALGLVLLAFMVGGFVTALTANIGLWSFARAIGYTALILGAAFVVQRYGRGTLPPEEDDTDES
jgi:asparagine N-glycosylation enzyme membrane subunit Stt3